MSVTEAGLGGLEMVVNRYLALDPLAMEKLAALHGRVICIEVLGVGVRLYLVPGPSGIQVLGHHEGEPDCTLRGTPLGLARMGLQRERTDPLFSGAVEIRGDTELGHKFGNILSGLDIDWEEQLSRLTGDVVAHEIGNGVRDLTHWGSQVLHNLGLDVQEYLQEEVGLLPPRAEIEAFLSDVDTLRDDVERLQERIAHLRPGKTADRRSDPG